MYATGSLSTHMANLLKIQSEMIERHRQIIQKGDKAHTFEAETSKYTVFETNTYMLLEQATGKPKDMLHSRKLDPFLVLGHTDNTYNLQNLVSNKEVRVNVKGFILFFLMRNA